MMNGQPLSTKKKVRILIALTLLAWATQTLFHQWGFGQEVPAIPLQPDDSAHDVPERFVPQSSLLAGAGTMELRSQAIVLGSEIRLKQVCRWSDADGNAFSPVADLVLQRLNANEKTRLISLDDLRQMLHDAGVNIAVIRFCGATICNVKRGDFSAEDGAALQQWLDEKKPTAPADQPQLSSFTQPPAVAEAKPKPASVRTLRDELMLDLSQRLNIPVESLQVKFEGKDSNLLNLAEPAFHFDIQPRRVRELGEVSWEVSIVAEGNRQKIPIVAQARSWETQAVLNRPLTYRQLIRDEDVTEHRVLVDHLEDTAVLAKSQVVGQEAARDLATGTVMTARLVTAVPLVKSGQYVTVTFNQGCVQVKTVAKALEAGSYGQTIQVKNEETKDVFAVRLVGPQAGVLGPTAPEVSPGSAR